MSNEHPCPTNTPCSYANFFAHQEYSRTEKWGLPPFVHQLFGHFFNICTQKNRFYPRSYANFLHIILLHCSLFTVHHLHSLLLLYRVALYLTAPADFQSCVVMFVVGDHVLYHRSVGIDVVAKVLAVGPPYFTLEYARPSGRTVVNEQV